MPPEHEYPVPPTPESAESSQGGWVHRHPYLATTITVGTLLIFLGSIVASRLGVVGTQSNGNWVGTGSIFSGSDQQAIEAARLRAEEAVKRGSANVEVGPIPITVPTTEGETETEIDFVELLASLIQPRNATNTVSIDVSSAFSFIPQGLVSTSNLETKRTPTQEALHSYGNEVGTLIQGFESSHTNSVPILKDHAEDRGNAAKAKEVDNLGYALAAFGRDLGQLQNIPPEAAAAHSALATTYRQVGTNLTKVAATTNDEQFLEAVNIYNASVESLSKRFFVLVSVFTANNVTFSPSEPGSVFMFTGSLSL